MKSPFIDFTEEQYQKYYELFNYNTETNDGKLIVWGGEDTYLTLVQDENGDLFMEIEEYEGDYLPAYDCIYQTTGLWWCPVGDLDKLVEDVKNGEELYYGEYE